MRLQARDLHHLPVETARGIAVGRLIDWEIDTETQAIRTYHVQSKTRVPGLYGNTLLIDRQQVISITNEKMVVDDLAVTEAEAEKRLDARAIPGLGGSA